MEGVEKSEHEGVEKPLRKPAERALFSLSLRGVVFPFLARFGLFFCILAAPWPGLSKAEVGAFATLGNVVVERDSSESPVLLRFDTPEHPCGGLAIARACWNVDLVLSNRSSGQSLRLPVDTRVLAYLPLVAFLSLGLASTLSTKRSLKVVGGGSVLMLVIVSIFSALPVLSILSDAGVLSDGTVAPLVIGLLWRAVVSPGMMFIVPALLWWMLIAITREKRPWATALGKR